MEQQREYGYIGELKDLFSQPKTLRNMKGTKWVETEKQKAYCLSEYYFKVKASDFGEYTAIMKSLNCAIKKGGELSEELLNNFVFSEYSDIVPIYRFNKKEGSDLIKSLCRCFKRIEDKMSIISYLNWDIKQYDEYSKDIDSIKRVGKNRNVNNIEEYVKETLASYKAKQNEFNESINKCEIEIIQLKKEYDEIEQKIANEIGITPIGYEAVFRNECKIKYNCSVRKADFKIKRLIGKEHFKQLFLQECKKPYLKTGGDYEYYIKYEYHNEGKPYYLNVPNTQKSEGGYEVLFENMVIFNDRFLKKGVNVRNTNETDTLFIDRMFNITEKRMKSWNIENVKDEDKYISHKKLQNEFNPYEENGVECLYVKLGYKCNGAKNNNYNRGTLESLKSAFKENNCNMVWCEKTKKYVKSKDIKKIPTKKDDLIRILMKM